MLGDCPEKQQLTQVNSMMVKREFTWPSLLFRFFFQVFPWTEAIPQCEKRGRTTRVKDFTDGTAWAQNHQRFQPMIDAMTPEKPHMCHTQSDDWWTCHAR